jgi:hypothetical protein
LRNQPSLTSFVIKWRSSKLAGAQFDGSTKTWSRTLTLESLTPDVLNPLFQAAMDYHTRIEAVQEDLLGNYPEAPGTEMAR